MLVLDGARPVNALTFTPDSKRLLAVCYGDPLAVWSMPDGERLPSPTPDAKAAGNLFVHPSGRVVYVTEPKVAVVPLTGRAEITHPPLGAVRSVSFSRDGRFAILEANALAGPSHGFRCDARGALAAEPTWTVGPHREREAVGGFVGAGEQFVTVDSRVIVIRDTATGDVRSTTKYPSYYRSSPTTSPDGRWLAVEGYGKLYLYDATTWAEPVRLNGRAGGYAPFAFHPTRPLFAALLGGSTLVKFLDPETGAVLTRFGWKIGDLRCVAFSPDGALAAVGSAKGKIVVWDVD